MHVVHSSQWEPVKFRNEEKFGKLANREKIGKLNTRQSLAPLI